MKVPVCEICAYTNNLCKPCKDRYAAGEITDADIHLSRILYSMAKHKEMGEISIARTITVNKLLLILVEDNPGILIGKAGKNIKRISQELGYSVRVINSRKAPREMIADLLWPIPVLGVNEVFSGGEEYVKIRLPHTYARRLPFDNDTLTKGAGRLFSKNAKIVFE